MIPARMILTLWALNLHVVSAWLPVGAPRTARVAAGTGCTHRQQRSMCLSAAAMESGSAGGRQDLVAMKKAFEGSMDNKLIMEYVMELRARKSLLLSSLEETGGVITDDIYSVMEELALVNPSSGCGAGSDKGKSHYCAMLPGHWIAASTVVPNVPFVFGDGEKGKKGAKAAPTSSPSNGDGPTCTLGELISVISGKSGGGSGTAAPEYNADIPVRPLRARISALTNTVKDGEMPTVVAVAGFSPAAEPRPVQAGGPPPGGAASAGQAAAAAAGEGSGEEEKDAKAKALAAALVEAAAKEPRAAAAAGGAGVRAEGFGRTADVAITDDGAVRGRGKWGVRGGYHLRWEFETMNVDLGGDRIVKAAGDGGEDEDGGRDLYEFFLDQNLMIVAWKDSPKKEDAVVFVRDEVPR